MKYKYYKVDIILNSYQDKIEITGPLNPLRAIV